MVCSVVADREGHVVNYAFCSFERTEYKVGTMFSFAEHVRDTVCSAGYALIECVVVLVRVLIGCCHQCHNHEGVHLGL